MTTAAAAEYTANIGHDFTLADAYDSNPTDDETPEYEEAVRQALNQEMARWFGID